MLWLVGRQSGKSGRPALGTNVHRPAATAVDTQPAAGLHTQEHRQHALSQSFTGPSTQELLALVLGTACVQGLASQHLCQLARPWAAPNSNRPWCDLPPAALGVPGAMAGRKEPVHDLLEGSPVVQGPAEITQVGKWVPAPVPQVWIFRQ